MRRNTLLTDAGKTTLSWMLRKTREVVIDIRSKQLTHTPILINGTARLPRRQSSLGFMILMAYPGRCTPPRWWKRPTSISMSCCSWRALTSVHPCLLLSIRGTIESVSTSSISFLHELKHLRQKGLRRRGEELLRTIAVTLPPIG